MVDQACKMERETQQTTVVVGGHLSCFAVFHAVQSHQQFSLMLHHLSSVMYHPIMARK